MALEIERKFRVRGDGWKRHVVRARRLRQAYLTRNERISLRVRIDNDEAATLTIKTARSGIQRNEYEVSIPVADARELMEQREGAVVSKTRHIVRNGGLNWEVDVFDGENSGLVIAEIELDRADRAIELPSWIGEEVTDDRRFYNAELATSPFSTWPLGPEPTTQTD
jgi:adenylate cyclase